MKYRNGFVSNSSSSSFLIALKKTSTPCPHCGRKDPDFLDMVEQSGNDDNCVDFTCSAEMKLEIMELGEKENSEGYNWMSEQEYNNLKNGIAKYVNNDEWIIAEITLSNHDSNLRVILDNLVRSGNAEIFYKTD